MTFFGTHLSATDTHTHGSRGQAPSINNVAVDGLVFFPRICEPCFPGDRISFVLELCEKKDQVSVSGFFGSPIKCGREIAKSGGSGEKIFKHLRLSVTRDKSLCTHIYAYNIGTVNSVRYAFVCFVSFLS